VRAWLCASALALAACDDVNVHVYSGQLFVAQGQCLQPSTGLDLISGPATGNNCGPACLTETTPGGPVVYVSTVCPPYPQGASIEAPDAALDGGDPCVAAFSALAGGATCGNDGGGVD
jgi:hypothetical protein